MDEGELVKLKGWEFLDPEVIKRERGRLTQKAAELDQLAYRVFASADGQKLLKWMVRQTIMQPSGGPQQTERGAGIREGQNDLVRQLLHMIERSKRGGT